MTLYSLPMTIPQELMQSRYSHLHHAQTLMFLEQGRIGLLESLGHPIDALMHSGLALVIVRIDISYKRELRAEPIQVTCDGGALEGRSVKIEQRILNAKGKEAVRATVWSAAMSIESRRGLDLPADFRNAFAGWLKGT